jgi:hypothetical protein
VSFHAQSPLLAAKHLPLFHIKTIQFMKTLIASFVFSMMCIFNSNAQQMGDITAKSVSVVMVRESEQSMSQGTQKSLTMELPTNDMKIIERTWKDFVDKYKGKTKRDRRSEEYFTDNASIPGMNGSNTVDLYTKFVKNGSDATTMNLWIDMGGAYVNQDGQPAAYTEAERMMRDYLKSLKAEQTKVMLDEEQKKLDKSEKELKKLQKNKENLIKDIENWKEKIKKAESEIETNIKDQDAAQKNLEMQRQNVEIVRKKLSELN